MSRDERSAYSSSAGSISIHIVISTDSVRAALATKSALSLHSKFRLFFASN